MLLSQQESLVDAPPGSRLFVVCGKAVEADQLQTAFMPYGMIQSVKVIREKGVAYVKYDKASSAALAMENLNGAVLNNGRGPKLKVLLAESPNQRALAPPKPVTSEQEISNDPDNVPPRSRLFIVVPKQAEAQSIQNDLGGFQDLEYCKTDLIAAKGVVFCKFTKASSALKALEDISTRGAVAGYKVKCMLAEPKTKRGRPEASHDVYSPMHQAAKLSEYGLSPDQMAGMAMKLPVGGGLSPSQIGVPDYSAIGSLSGLAGSLGGFNALGANNMDMHALSAQVGLGFSMGLSGLHANGSPVSTSSSPMVSKQRLFVVVHKSVAEDNLARLFRRWAGMEYCDLKKDRATGKSKGYCYINYSTPDAAAAAMSEVNGMEFPSGSGHRIKVMYAEPLGVRNHSGSRSPMPLSSPSPVTPLSRNISPDLATVESQLATMSVQRVSSAPEDLDRRMASPMNPSVARELMFNGA